LNGAFRLRDTERLKPAVYRLGFFCTKYPEIRILDYYEAVGQVLAFHVNWLRARGYRLFSPRNPWAWPNTLYWRKDVK